MAKILDALQRRYSTKRFDPNFVVSKQDEFAVLEAIRLAPTSYGLQPFRVVVVQDRLLKEQLKVHSYNQPQVTECGLYLVFAIETLVDKAFVEGYVQNIADTRGVSTEQLKGFSDVMHQKVVVEMSQEQRCLWASKQAYIALGLALTAAAELGLDACPMEGFNPSKYDEVLNLAPKGLQSVVSLAIGKRSSLDVAQHNLKVRRGLDGFVLFK